MLYGIPPHFDDATWESWTPRPELEKAVEVLQRWEGDPPSVLLLSPANGTNLGTGKTRALCSAVKAWRDRGAKAWYYPVTRIVRIEQQLMDGDHEMYQDEYGERGSANWCCSAPHMVAFDDLGAEHGSSWSIGLMERIADERYASDFPTLYATNLDERSLQIRYPRLWRRCTEGLMLAWQAPLFDRRLIRSKGALHVLPI
jgi:hypothetical protein